jgi:hypothetical protein
MSLADDHKTLVRHLATLEAHKQGVSKAKKKLGDRAVEQYDSLGPALDTIAAGHEKDKGGILTHRRYRTMLTERSRLAAIVHPHEHLNDSDT